MVLSSFAISFSFSRGDGGGDAFSIDKSESVDMMLLASTAALSDCSNIRLLLEDIVSRIESGCA